MSRDNRKQEVLEMLRKNELYVKAVEAAPDEAQRRYIKAYAEDFVMKFYEGIYKNLGAAVDKDPDALRKVVADLNDSLIKSGSIDK